MILLDREISLVTSHTLYREQFPWALLVETIETDAITLGFTNLCFWVIRNGIRSLRKKVVVFTLNH